MLQDKPQEVFAFEGAAKDFLRAAFDILKGYIAIFIGDDVAFTDYAPVKVARQVF